MDFKKALEPVVNNFIAELEAIKKTAEGRVEELDKLIADTKNHNDELKAQGIENAKNHNLALDKVTGDRAKLSDLHKQVDDEIKRYQALEKDLGEKVTNASKELESAKIERKLSSDILEKAKEEAKKNEDIGKLLKADFDKLDTEKKALTERDRLVTVKEKINLDKTQELAQKEKELSEKQLDLSVKEQNIKIEMKRMKT